MLQGGCLCHMSETALSATRATHTSTSAILSSSTASTLVVPDSASERPRMLSSESASGFWSKCTLGLRVLSMGTVKEKPSRRSRESGTEREPRKRRRWLGGVKT
jgi:hypothetical protein